MLYIVKKNYTIYQDPSRPEVCVVDATNQEGRRVLRQYYQGWLLTHDLLGDCAPATYRMIGEDRVEREFINGSPMSHVYGTALMSNRRSSMVSTMNHLWPKFLERLPIVWESNRTEEISPSASAKTLWGTWFGIAELKKGKHQSLLRSWQYPMWSIQSLKALLVGKFSGGYTAIPDVVYEIMDCSRQGMLLGDLHFENIIFSEKRLVFIDFSEVGRGPIALDLAPLWFTWYLPQVIFQGNDNFLNGFRLLWRKYVGPELLLCEMTRLWMLRAFPWLYFSFSHFHLKLKTKEAFHLTCLLKNLSQVLNRKGFCGASLEDMLKCIRKVSHG